MSRLAELEARKGAVLEKLNDENFEGDTRALVEEARAIGDEINEFNTAVHEANEARSRLMAAQPNVEVRSAMAQPGRQAEPSRDRGELEHRVVSLGQAVGESDDYKRFVANGGRGEVRFDINLETRALLANGAAGMFPQNPIFKPDVPMVNPDRVLRLADLIDRRQTGNNIVEYVRDTTAFAGGQTAAETAEGLAKPQAAYTFELVTDPIATVAHWLDITRQAASDLPQLRGYIDGRLMYGLDFRLDRAILVGDGIAPNMRGILNTSGRGTYAAPSAEARIKSIRRAKTVAQLSEYEPDTVVLNPTDWEKVEIYTAPGSGEFNVSPNVQQMLTPKIWGLTVVATTAMPAGRGLVGSFKEGATLWDREQAQILVTDSDQDKFTKNILTLLAELRAGLSIWRPRAFVDITFDAAGN